MQDTGNPVLDSTVNIAIAHIQTNGKLTADQLEDIVNSLHPKLLEIAEKEPGGLKRDGALRLSKIPKRPNQSARGAVRQS